MAIFNEVTVNQKIPVHIRYSDAADGSNMSEDPSSTTKYMGVYVNVTASDNPADYKWSEIKGDSPDVEAYARTGATALSANWLSLTAADGPALTPETGTLYCVINGSTYTNQLYRWGGSEYIEIGGTTGAAIVSTTLVGQDANGGNIYEQTFDNGVTARFTAPKGAQGEDGAAGVTALVTTNMFATVAAPFVGEEKNFSEGCFTRTPVVGEYFSAVHYGDAGTPAVAGRSWIGSYQVTEVLESGGVIIIIKANTLGVAETTGSTGVLPTSLPATSAKLSGSIAVEDWTAEIAQWESANMPISASWSMSAYGNGKFVALIGYNNVMAYSSDGITWTESTMPSNYAWDGVTYGNDKFVAVGGAIGNKSAYSADGITWTETTMPSSASWKEVVYGNGIFVASSSTSGIMAYSEDGITWQLSTTLPTGSVPHIAFGNGKFVATGGNNTSRYAYSTDGITWTTSSLPRASIAAVAYGGGKFITVGDNNSYTNYSYDGVSWSQGTLPSSTWGGIIYANGQFIAFGANKFAYSADGITWAEEATPSTYTPLSLAYGNNKVVAVGNSQTSLYLSTMQIYKATISNAEIKTNSFSQLFINDSNKFEAESKTDGSVAIKTETLPSAPIPYTLQVVETSTEGVFEIINSYAPEVPTIKVFTNTAVAVADFVADTTYASYGYRATIALNGVTADMVAEVVFALNEAVSGKYAPVAETYAGGVYIYANAVPDGAITIPTITVVEG